MMEDRYIELMNREIDGVNAPEESEALRAHLASNAEARRYYEELRGLAGIFAAAGEVNPPADLNREIMRAVDARSALRSARGAAGARAGFFGVFSPGKRLAYSFVAGLAVGLIALVIVLGAVSKQNRFDRSDLYGALGTWRAAGPVVAEERVPLAIGGVSGTIDVRYFERSVLVTLDLEADREIETTLRADTASVTVKGSGRCAAAFAFEDEAGSRPAVDVSIDADGGRIFERTVVGERSGAVRE